MASLSSSPASPAPWVSARRPCARPWTGSPSTPTSARRCWKLKFPAEAAGQPHYEAVPKRVRRWLAALLEGGELAPRERLEAGDLLGRLGDPRPGVGVRTGPRGEALPDIDWVEIPTGTFTMGSSDEDPDAYPDERPAHEQTLPVYRIARHPVTNAQFRPFLEADGYEQERWWTAEGWAWRQGAKADLSAIEDEDWRRRFESWLGQRPAERRDRPFWWDETPWNGANRPVVWVSWHEAMAYCRWLGERLREKTPGVSVRLPSEVQCEKAARGNDARRWPWGDDWRGDHANTSEAGLETTSPVGLFPAGLGPFGTLDMAGNVWEWTRSKRGSGDMMRPDFVYPYDALDGRESQEDPDRRVVRGGSWNGNLRFAPCACRVRVPPGDFGNGLGFRLVLSLADPGSRVLSAGFWTRCILSRQRGLPRP